MSCVLIKSPRDPNLPDLDTRPSKKRRTSSTRDVSPISAIDEVELPAVPGPVTAGLMAAFADLVARTTDP